MREAVEASAHDATVIADLFGIAPDHLLAGLDAPDVPAVGETQLADVLDDRSLCVPRPAGGVDIAAPILAAVRLQPKPEAAFDVEVEEGDHDDWWAIAVGEGMASIVSAVTDDRVRYEVIEADDVAEVVLDLLRFEPRPVLPLSDFVVPSESFDTMADRLDEGDEIGALGALTAAGANLEVATRFVAALVIHERSCLFAVTSDVDRCELRWVDGGEHGVWFVSPADPEGDAVRVEPTTAALARAAVLDALRASTA